VTYDAIKKPSHWNNTIKKLKMTTTSTGAKLQVVLFSVIVLVLFFANNLYVEVVNSKELNAPIIKIDNVGKNLGDISAIKLSGT
jgi:hypothetical protein